MCFNDLSVNKLFVNSLSAQDASFNKINLNSLQFLNIEKYQNVSYNFNDITFNFTQNNNIVKYQIVRHSSFEYFPIYFRIIFL